MEGIIISIEKEELEDIIYKAVGAALATAAFVRQKEKPADIDEFIMKSPELCKYLKMKISTLYQKTHKRQIPFNKQGKTMYFKKDEIDKWLADGKQEMEVEQNIEREIRIGLADRKRIKTIA
ncbi:MAG: helix-turn-helix domain-containing protein [Bacteroidota bacterium]|nr:helix-turn-helix domain-containing protein [Bacteroidota bacterium]